MNNLRVGPSKVGWFNADEGTSNDVDREIDDALLVSGYGACRLDRGDHDYGFCFGRDRDCDYGYGYGYGGDRSCLRISQRASRIWP